MSVNGQNGNVSRDSLIAMGCSFYAFAAAWTHPNGNVIPAGSEIAAHEYQSIVSSFVMDSYVRAPGDGLFVVVSDQAIEASEWQIDADVLDSGNLGGMTPTGATATVDQLSAGQGQWTNPNTQQVFQGQNGLAAWYGYALATMTDVAILQAVQNQWGAVFNSKRRALLRAVLGNVQIATYVPSQEPQEGQEFPPQANNIQSGMAILLAQSMPQQTEIITDTDGGPTFALLPPPT